MSQARHDVALMGFVFCLIS